MALQKVKDSMRTTVALDATKLAGAVPSGSLGNAVAADDSITLAKMAPGTDGQVITYSAAGDPVAIGPGTAGQVLTSAGANLPQTFATPAAGGKVLQVRSTSLAVVSTYTIGTTWIDFTDFNVAITPTATSSNILVFAFINVSDPTNQFHLRLVRDSTAIGVGVNDGNRIGCTAGALQSMNDHRIDQVGLHFYDEAVSTTSEVVYKIQVYMSTANTLKLNTSQYDGNSGYGARAMSMITAVEIGA